MRTIALFTLLFVLSSLTLSAQQSASESTSKSNKNRVIIQVDDKEPFTVFLNEKKMNAKPATKVILEDLERQSYDIKIDFFRNTKSIKKKLIVKEGKEAIYKLNKIKTGEFVFQLDKETTIPGYKKGKAEATLTGGGSSSSASESTSKSHNNRIIIQVDDKEPFTVFLNEKKMNDKPATRVVLENLERQSYDIKVDFFRNTKSIKKKLIVKEGKEATYKLNKIKSGEFVLQLDKEKDLPGSASSSSSASESTTKEKYNKIVVYNDDKEPFTIFLNGEKVTPKPGARLTLENLERDSYDIKIDFYRNVKSINKKLIVKHGMESIYKLKKVKEGEYVFQLEKANKLPIKAETGKQKTLGH